MIRLPRSWFKAAVSVLWVGFAVFVIYYGDGRSNLLVILWSDGRIRRTPLYIGLGCGFLNVGLILYTILLPRSLQKSSDECDAFLSTAPSAVVLGFISFCLISYSLWPVWGILTILLMSTLFMSTLVILSNLSMGPFEPESLREA